MPSTISDRLNGLTTSVAIKAACRVATTANITLSGLQTVNGVALSADDRVLVKDQTSGSQNGVYTASTSTWQRAKDFDGNRDVKRGTFVPVVNTSGSADLYEVTTDDPITIGTTSITFELRYSANTRYDRTAAEIAAGVTPVDYAHPPLNVLRFIPSSEHAGIEAGTNTFDCADAIDNAFAAAGSAAVEFPKGVYYVSRGIAHGPTMHIIAHEATIRKTTNTVGTSGTRTFNGATDDYNVDFILALLHNNGAYGRILIEGRLQLRSGAASAVAFGLYIPRFFYSSVRNLNTQDCAIGVRGMTGILSDFVNIQCFGTNTTTSTHGIQIEDFAVANNQSTSLNFNACWGVDVNKAYQLAATYSTMINCAADRCGTEIYRFDAGSVTLVGCGSEGSLHAPVFYFNGGRHRAIQCRIIQPHAGTQARGLVFSSSPAVVDGEFICDDFTDAGSALKYEVNSGATLRVYPGNVWPTNGGAASVTGTYREFSALSMERGLAGRNIGDLLRSWLLSITGQGSSQITLGSADQYNFDAFSTSTTSALSVGNTGTVGSGATLVTYTWVSANTVDIGLGAGAAGIRGISAVSIGRNDAADITVRATVSTSKVRLAFFSAGASFDLATLTAGQVLQAHVSAYTSL